MKARFQRTVCVLAALVYFVCCDQGIEIEKTSTPSERVWVQKARELGFEQTEPPVMAIP